MDYKTNVVLINDKFLTQIIDGYNHMMIKWKDNSDLTWGDWVNQYINSQETVLYLHHIDDRCRFDDVNERVV